MTFQKWDSIYSQNLEHTVPQSVQDFEHICHSLYKCSEKANTLTSFHNLPFHWETGDAVKALSNISSLCVQVLIVKLIFLLLFFTIIRDLDSSVVICELGHSSKWQHANLYRIVLVIVKVVLH